MKYMGSKSKLLQHCLGDILKSEASSGSRVVDLFCGGASVSWFAATELKKPVFAYDLQQYAVTLAGCIVKRTQPLKYSEINDKWITRTKRSRCRFKGWREARELDTTSNSTFEWQQSSQELCASTVGAKSSLIWRCYGGHYFSPTQALTFDALIRCLPDKSELKDLCLAATIVAASQCAAAPGHTAQPFKATQSAARHLRSCWLRDPLTYAQIAAKKLSSIHAFTPGDACVGDANIIAKNLKDDDIVFVDPPYSNVQYSRFYHVLETIARGYCNDVEGVGRYPPLLERPNSRYSRISSSIQAIDNLLLSLSETGCKVILTFPKNECSNGLSGDRIEATASNLFHVTKNIVKSRFSTLGGNLKNRLARMNSEELILVLTSK